MIDISKYPQKAPVAPDDKPAPSKPSQTYGSKQECWTAVNTCWKDFNKC